MDQPPQRSSSASASRAYQFHPARAAINDIFNLYLGRNSRHRADDSVREPPNKAQKRVVALNTDLPPQNDQFIVDFQQLHISCRNHTWVVGASNSCIRVTRRCLATEGRNTNRYPKAKTLKCVNT